MEKKIRLGICSPDPNDGTSYYRAWGPFSKLHDICDLSEVSPSAGWRDFIKIDALLVQRPIGGAYVNLLQEARKHGVPVWCDWDDNVFQVPSDNPSVDAFTAELPSIEALVGMATACTVSTVTLLQTFEKHLPQINKLHLIPNGVDTDFYNAVSIPKRQNSNFDKVVLWRGSQAQAEDIRAFAQDIIELMNEHPKVLFCFQGYRPYYIFDHSEHKNFKHIPWSGVTESFLRQRLIQPDLVMVTLEETVFNQCRSAGSYLEGTMAGGMTVAPNWETWKVPGCYHYPEKKAFKETMLKALAMPLDDVRACHKLSYDYVTQQRSWLKLNELRRKVLRLVLGKKEPFVIPPIPV